MWAAKATLQLQLQRDLCNDWLHCLKQRVHGNVQDGWTPLEVCGVFGDLTPSCASCSRKPDQSSASDSFLLVLSGKKSVDNAGVLGVRCQGDNGTRRLGFEAPGRARPACSRWSAVMISIDVDKTVLSISYRLTKLVALQWSAKSGIFWDLLGRVQGSEENDCWWVVCDGWLVAKTIYRLGYLTYQCSLRACPSWDTSRPWSSGHWVWRPHAAACQSVSSFLWPPSRKATLVQALDLSNRRSLLLRQLCSRRPWAASWDSQFASASFLRAHVAPADELQTISVNIHKKQLTNRPVSLAGLVVNRRRSKPDYPSLMLPCRGLHDSS